MKQLRFFILLTFVLMSSYLTAELNYCFIKDEAKHLANQKLLESILEQELAVCPYNSPSDQANFLSRRIHTIGKALLAEGFLCEAYGTPTVHPQAYLCFNFFPLWEGKNHSIPLTFFVYAWPSKELALSYNSNDPRNQYYASLIHSHPISCAFAVLDGSLIQKSFELIEGTTVRLTHTERFFKGEGEIDDLSGLFIHQMYNPEKSTKLTLSLHIYGLDSSQKVIQSFNETASHHTYRTLD